MQFECFEFITTTKPTAGAGPKLFLKYKKSFSRILMMRLQPEVAGPAPAVAC